MVVKKNQIDQPEHFIGLQSKPLKRMYRSEYKPFQNELVYEGSISLFLSKVLSVNYFSSCRIDFHPFEVISTTFD